MKDNFLNRKEFLKLTAGLAIGSGLSYYLLKSNFKKQLLHSTNSSDQYAVIISIPGGLDCTLGLDPQIYTQGLDSSDIFIEYRENEIIKKGEISFGPAAKALAPHSQDLCIINGLSALKDAGHKLNLQQMLTGSMGGTLDHFSVQLASKAQTKPFGILTNSPIINQSSELAISDIATLSQRLKGSDQGLPIPGLAEILNNKLRAAAIETENAGQLSHEIFRSINRNQTWAQICFSTIAACFAGGLAASAEVDVTKYLEENYLDSHTNHEKTHLSSQTQAWEHVAQLFDIFKKVPYQQKSLFDFTTFIVVTEFSRTPNLNLTKGKDHNPYTNSMLLAGKGINGNQTIGKSKVWPRHQTVYKKPIHTGLPVDFTTGEIILKSSPQSDLIMPENIAKTLLTLFKTPDTSDVLQKFKVLPKVIKT